MKTVSIVFQLREIPDYLFIYFTFHRYVDLYSASVSFCDKVYNFSTVVVLNQILFINSAVYFQSVEPSDSTDRYLNN